MKRPLANPDPIGRDEGGSTPPETPVALVPPCSVPNAPPPPRLSGTCQQAGTASRGEGSISLETSIAWVRECAAVTPGK
ncbi:hypothetical protein F751_5762 [Auxenochlorella protothecoides]|uniref:Uncharacterized protein n=1 Tax=Auxenochlorella protothecoides TaxID=3075 RepID=A0A087SUC0_AUXPR|nr:hypothetical protein F751_5762 [Auxenochlorella protothecoides]KFM29324.1 hypothetical protein F751_5762 [Auxenochlorella protothecoides]